MLQIIHKSSQSGFNRLLFQRLLSWMKKIKENDK